MAYEISEFPPLSWSFSRMKTLIDCPRKYYYNFYGYHNGWLKDAEEEAQTTYRLKKLNAIDALFGQVFHEKVKATIKEKSGVHLVPDTFRRAINRAIKSAYIDSKSSLSEWIMHPNWYKMISEVYYDGDICGTKKESIAQKANISSTNLYASSTFKELTERGDVGSSICGVLLLFPHF
ncbi:MAG: hypothetical protein M0Z55_11925 [Peptococcaceae bacterium]|nr:hypothetical protein [Peptococcaceae bacterium]